MGREAHFAQGKASSSNQFLPGHKDRHPSLPVLRKEQCSSRPGVVSCCARQARSASWDRPTARSSTAEPSFPRPLQPSILVVPLPMHRGVSFYLPIPVPSHAPSHHLLHSDSDQPKPSPSARVTTGPCSPCKGTGPPGPSPQPMYLERAIGSREPAPPSNVVLPRAEPPEACIHQRRRPT